MPTKLKFPYQYKTIEFGQIPDPFIEMGVATKAGWQQIGFLVDSGADATTLPLFLAEIWEVKFDKRRYTMMGGVEGQGVKAYPSQIKVRLGKEELTIRCYFIDSEIAPLLGRVDFWDQYNLVFDNHGQELIFEKLKSPSFLARLWAWLEGE